MTEANFSFPDYSFCCPLCSAKDCCRFMGYYYRKVVIDTNQVFKNFPIARFRCRAKGKRKIVNHQTFSLLPYQLIPYSKYSIEFLLEITAYWQKNSIKETLDRFYPVVSGLSTLYKIKKSIMIPTIKKLIIKEYIASDTTIEEFIDYCQGFESDKFYHPIRGPSALNIDHYKTNGSYYKNAHFLFGKASQFRLS